MKKKTPVNLLFCISAFVFLMLYASTIVFCAENPMDIIKKVRTRIENFKNFTCQFSQDFHWKLLGETHNFKGKFFLSNPNKFRVELKDKIILSDGKTVWTYVPGNEQVLISAYEEELKNVSPHLILMKYEKAYNAIYQGEERIEGERCHVVEFTAKTDVEEYTMIRVWIDRKLELPVKIEQIDEDENVRTFTLSKYILNTELHDSLFVFHPPENIEVIDLREE